MARSYGKILASIWADPDWRELPATAQRLYMLLLSQPKLTLVGTLDVVVQRWAMLAGDTTTDDLEADLAALAAARFVVVDRVTDELVVRTLVRHDVAGGRLNINLLKGLWGQWSAVLSLTIRQAIIDEVPDEVWEKSAGHVPAEALRMRRSDRLEPTVETNGSNHPSEPVVQTNGSNQPSEPPLSSLLSPVSSHLSPVAAPERPARGLPSESVIRMAGGAGDNSAEERIAEAASLCAWDETARRDAAGELANPDGYQRSRVKPLREQHESAWRRVLGESPDATAQELVDSLAGRRPQPSTRAHPLDGAQAAQLARAEAGNAQIAEVLATPPAPEGAVRGALDEARQRLRSPWLDPDVRPETP